MDPFILAQIFGLLGSMSMILSSWQKDRSKVLLFVMLDSVFYIVQYILLNALSGVFTNVVSLIRTLLFKYKSKNKFLQNKLILFFIVIVYIVVGFFSHNGITSIFPVAASIFYSIVLWQDDVRKIRLGTAVTILSWVIYNFAVGAYLSAVVEGLLFVSAVTAIIKLDIPQNRKLNITKQIDKRVKQ